MCEDHNGAGRRLQLQVPLPIVDEPERKPGAPRADRINIETCIVTFAC